MQQTRKQNQVGQLNLSVLAYKVKELSYIILKISSLS